MSATTASKLFQPDHVTPALLQSVAEARAISFDVFDTLFVRPLQDPEDAFDMLGEKFGIPDFRALRRAAQQHAFVQMADEGRREITLDGIYSFLEGLPVRAAALKQAEYDLELALTLPNPEMIGLFRELVEQQRQVVITSDMYMPSAFFLDLFQRHGVPPVPMFISSDRNATKRDHGELFRIVSEELGVEPASLLHIGDNPHSDVAKALESGMKVFHYRTTRPSRSTQPSSPSASLAGALSKIHDADIKPGSFHELGFSYGGPAAFGFLQWIKQHASADGIDLLLFMSRDGYVLDHLVRQEEAGALPASTYFEGSRTAFTLAAINEHNFDAHLDFLLSGSHGLSPFEVFERIGVVAPADCLLDDLGLGRDVKIQDSTMPQMRTLLRALRWRILEVCRRNRRGLFHYLRKLQIKPGMRLGLVDIGWSGTTQNAFEKALSGIVEVSVTGYYFCLVNSPERLRRQVYLNMKAMVSEQTVSSDLLDRIYANRVAAELLFSAPHDAVIGYDVQPDGTVSTVTDRGRGKVTSMQNAAREITRGVEEFGSRFREICRSAGFEPWPLDTTWPFIEFITHPERAMKALGDIQNFDAWASTRNSVMRTRDYL
ncbi:HAD family hydrolase [Pseudoroseomonas ludipueritiae]|uniref:Hydrolase n=1 Tax=Pseudoroseomonas ludipueritiae TaxID=198093 RepID=A0ABR7R5I4_9PROT|nr:hydrolase [Pseudoroseomonas ludipueritiae]MBC9177020.1 hydrolase [Pseudoroseomonas ludipueritiae]